MARGIPALFFLSALQGCFFIACGMVAESLPFVVDEFIKNAE